MVQEERTRAIGIKTNKQFKYILKAIADSGLKESLTKIQTYHCDIQKDEVKRVANGLGMKNILIE